MNVRFMHSLYMAALLGFTNSCIFDDLSDCPSPQYIVQVSVKDKNYKNIGDFPQLASKEENAPQFGNLSEVLHLIMIYNL